MAQSMPSPSNLPTQLPAGLLTNVLPNEQTAQQTARELNALLQNGATLKPAGDGKHDPSALLKRYRPTHKIELFGAHFWVSSMRHDEYLNFMVTYVGLENARGQIRSISPRIFYKDSSLVWRVASHYISTDDEHWIGKGDVRWEQRADGEYLSSAEETTNLP